MDYDKLKPMLAAGQPKAMDHEQYLNHIASMLPMVATPKIDGIRCVCKSNGFPLSRSLKDIPNGFIRAYFYEHREAIKPCFDGELLVGSTFQQCTSGIMSHGGEPDFTYWIFDVPSSLPYVQRVDRYHELDINGALPERFKTVPTAWIHTIKDLEEFEAVCLEQGFEGVMLRKPNSPYKFGRSTVKQGWLLKLKRFTTAEAEVVGFEPMYHNTNDPKQSETGNQVRSTEKAGMVASDHLLGKFIVRGLNNGFEGVEFSIGSGLDMAQREVFWENKSRLIGQIIEFKYQPHGVKDAPRTPIFLRFRHANTL
jgi:DNA ligase 1